MVAEKNTIAEAIAKALSPYKPKAKKGRQAFYYYKSKFNNA